MNKDHEVSEYISDHDCCNEALSRLTAPVKRRKKTEQGRGDGRS